jgi:hypothetical protein
MVVSIRSAAATAVTCGAEALVEKLLRHTLSSSVRLSQLNSIDIFGATGTQQLPQLHPCRSLPSHGRQGLTGSVWREVEASAVRPVPNSPKPELFSSFSHPPKHPVCYPALSRAPICI